MILIALAGVCLLTVPLTGAHLSRLAEIRLRRTWTPIVALAIQVLIITVARGGRPTLHKALHIATYALIGPVLPWLGDIIPWPGPLANVLSVGDCTLYLGTLVLLHTLCRRQREVSANSALSHASGAH